MSKWSINTFFLFVSPHETRAHAGYLASLIYKDENVCMFVCLYVCMYVAAVCPGFI